MGCKSNQFEGAIIRENLNLNGMIEVEKIEDADIYILNSCSVTHKSDNEAMYLLRSAKHKNPSVKTLITGCVAQIEKEKLLENDFVDMVVGNDEKLELYKILKRHSELDSESKDEIPKQVQDVSYCFVSDIMKQTDFTKAILTDITKTRASIKVQDGCDNRCSYCIIPFARGKSRSADLDFVVDGINNFSKNGFKEVVITGIHIGQWGRDIGYKFIDLVKAIEEKTDIKRFRLGSLNPLEINNELLEYLAGSEKFCPHFHLSLQSACDKTLKSMNRFYKTEDYLAQIDKINEMFEYPFIGSDIITGFAGETDEDFQTTAENLKNSGLSQMHTFPYSVRKGTQGADMPNQIPENIRQKRAEIIKEISRQKYDEFLKRNIGQVHEVLIEKHSDKKTGLLKGVTRNYIKVLLNGKDERKLNTLCQAKITEIKDGRVYAEMI